MKGKIIIVDDEPLTRVDLRDMLELENYDVVGEAADGFEAIELAKKHQPDLVIMDIQMPLLDGLNAGKKIMSEKLANSILMLTAYSDVNHREKAMGFGASGYLVKPLDEKSFIPMVEVAITKGKEVSKLEKNVDKLSEKLEQRKVIEKAKGILMANQSIDEEAAYKQIRKLSMDKRCPMIDVAEMLVMAND
ncbi:ANTAR domain-containing response regulator [Vagococcus carniphilus]|uniref:Response regulator n=1 Tax=Vagococcus carniphilus TaxID=218144 RepID=A0A430B715_9ENTE|nr:response regulator [Vagococcus carniphilus]MDT2814499.1 response regulator [Vagococcus carniphilus]MDT2830566.1 response regulator [Vagococcus carniphilus]MDT2832612.1 response regulator [Vagococcus carniphilus]MDT2839864.1 response regulator [Vagococcus carniphilus]MDT2849747.1 response regulator [Vagococcus carniphilus]